MQILFKICIMVTFVTGILPVSLQHAISAESRPSRDFPGRREDRRFQRIPITGVILPGLVML